MTGGRLAAAGRARPPATDEHAVAGQDRRRPAGRRITTMVLTAGTASLAAALTVVAVSADASIPAPGGTITACYLGQAPQRYLRLIDTQAGEKCFSDEDQLTWNQTGPQGAPGTSLSAGYVQSFAFIVPGIHTPPVTLATFSALPAGSYIMTVTGQSTGRRESQLTCSFSPAGATGEVSLNEQGFQETIADGGEITLAQPGAITFSCSAEDASIAVSGQVTAVQVASPAASPDPSQR
jgi:hypothetical protein